MNCLFSSSSSFFSLQTAAFVSKPPIFQATSPSMARQSRVCRLTWRLRRRPPASTASAAVGLAEPPKTEASGRTQCTSKICLAPERQPSRGPVTPRGWVSAAFEKRGALAGDPLNPVKVRLRASIRIYKDTDAKNKLSLSRTPLQRASDRRGGEAGEVDIPSLTRTRAHFFLAATPLRRLLSHNFATLGSKGR